MADDVSHQMEEALTLTTSQTKQQQPSQKMTLETKSAKAIAVDSTYPHRKREAVLLGVNLVVVGLCAAGLVLSLRGLIRGDQDAFAVAFATAISLTCVEIVLNLVFICIRVSFRTRDKPNRRKTGCRKMCDVFGPGIFADLTYLVICCISLGLLIVALLTSSQVAKSNEFGCLDGFGCANILAITVAAIYGIRSAVLAVQSICLVCCCCFGAVCM